MSEQFNCGTFKDPSEFPPDIRAMMDKDRAEAEREWTAEDRAELAALRAENARLAEALRGNEAKLADVKSQLLEMLDLIPVPGSRWRMNIKSMLRTIDAALGGGR